ncbi:MAG: DNA repair protein RecN [Deltaproteobacteria bacterium]|nr:DNA repair protein RecN [Deltaproteobacteria bacterium]MCL5793052.1 DNA repair protein RecN [Deltaproteobacteria bacterium]
MLKSLRLKNLAVFSDVTIPFDGQFCIISGETGAGKSIMVDGMLALLGGRTDETIVRDGVPEAIVEGLFNIEDNKEIRSFLELHGFESSSELVIKRVITSHGRSRAYVNGTASTLSTLAELSKLLVDIHSQHEHQSLLDEANHVSLLDAYAGLEQKAFEVKNLYTSLITAMHDYDRLIQDIDNVKRQEELMRFQFSEINSAKLKLGEDKELEHEYKLLTNAQQILTELNIVYNFIYDDETGAHGIIVRAIKAIGAIKSIDPVLNEFFIRLEPVAAELKDIAQDINSYMSKVEINEQRHADVEQRLSLIDNLKKKYGNTIQGILDYAGNMYTKLNKLEHNDEYISSLKQDIINMKEQIYKKSMELSDGRKSVSKELSKKIEKELITLGIKNAKFEINIQNTDVKDAISINDRRITATGTDLVRFYFSANPGFALKLLTEIISGGELSRAMLAIKRVLANASKVPVLVFDEIDTGIGGSIAEVVGKKLKELSKYHQVICITHLYQIAGFGDFHINIQKHAACGSTEVAAKVLAENERIEEIARMLSGTKITDLSRNQAKEFLKHIKEQT